MEPLVHLSTQQLEYLVEVVEHPTWAEAASSLGVSPSALSQGLAQLERRIGVALFERRKRSRSLTEPGERVLAYARLVVAQTRELTRWAENVNIGTNGNLRVGMIDLAAITFFGQHLKQFRRRYPGLDFHLEVEGSAALSRGVESGHLDFAVIVEPALNPGTLEFIALLEDELAVYVPEGVGVDDPTRWGPWVTFPRQSHTRSLIAGRLAERGIPFEVVAESRQPEVLREMVVLGLGWTVLPVLQAEPDADKMGAMGAPSLKRAAAQSLGSRQIVIARRHESPVANPAATTLINELVEVAALISQNSGGSTPPPAGGKGASSPPQSG